MTIHLKEVSDNLKTGPIPVSTTSKETCSDNCAFKNNGCYADNFPLKLHWNQVTAGNRGTDLDTFCASVAAFPDGQLWRHNQAGDLPGENDVIYSTELRKIVRANRGKKGFTYTHKSLTPANKKAIKHANENGFTINVSTDSLAQADKAKRANIGPVVVVVAENHPEHSYTPAGNKVLVCPVQTDKSESCATCKLCAWSGRDVIIGFRAHGNQKRKVSQLVTIGGTN